MNIQTDYSLKTLNQYGIDAKAKYFVEIKDTSEIEELVPTSRIQR